MLKIGTGRLFSKEKCTSLLFHGDSRDDFRHCVSADGALFSGSLQVPVWEKHRVGMSCVGVG